MSENSKLQKVNIVLSVVVFGLLAIDLGWNIYHRYVEHCNGKWNVKKTVPNQKTKATTDKPTE